MCRIADGKMTCSLHQHTLDPNCTGDSPAVLATFLGEEVTTECYIGASNSQAPTLETGQVASDAEGAFFCEGLAEGVKCTSVATGRTALFTPTKAGLLD